MAAISITVANVLVSSSGGISTGIAAVAITQGIAVYQLAVGTIGIADANGVIPISTFLGISLDSALAGQPVSYCGFDPAFNPGATITSGAAVYLSATPGAITETYADVLSGSYVTIIGIGNTDGTLKLQPLVGGVKP